MKLEILTPDDYIGDVTGDLNKRRGILENITSKIGYQAVRARVPLSTMFGYVTSLRSNTSGRASSSMEFSHYDQAPNNVIEEVVFKIKGIKINS
jgi:elongation factor G